MIRLLVELVNLLPGLYSITNDLNNTEIIIILKALAETWNNKMIPIEFEYILERAYLVRHLPCDKIAEVYSYITTLVDNLANVGNIDSVILQKLQDFAGHLRRFWLPLKDVLSVF